MQCVSHFSIHKRNQKLKIEFEMNGWAVNNVEAEQNGARSVKFFIRDEF